MWRTLPVFRTCHDLICVEVWSGTKLLIHAGIMLQTFPAILFQHSILKTCFKFSLHKYNEERLGDAGLNCATFLADGL